MPSNCVHPDTTVSRKLQASKHTAHLTLSQSFSTWACVGGPTQVKHERDAHKRGRMKTGPKIRYFLAILQQPKSVAGASQWAFTEGNRS